MRGKKNVVIDNGHIGPGYFRKYPALSELFESGDAVIRFNESFPLNEKLLKNTDVLVTFPAKPLSLEEADALERFLAEGGRMLVIGGDYRGGVCESNFFFQNYGISFERAGGMRGRAMSDHAIGEGVGEVRIGGPTARLIVQEPALAVLGMDESAGVAIFEDRGKMIVVADEYPVVKAGEYERFWANVISWLMDGEKEGSGL